MTDAVTEIRAFSRFYTGWVGALDRYHLGSDFSLAEVRVLYEMAQRPGLLARDIVAALAVDAGYLSRMLKRLEAGGWVRRGPAADDARASSLWLTAEGMELFRKLDRRAADTVRQAIAPLDEAERERLIASLSLSRRLLSKRTMSKSGHLQLRDPEPGDYGWAVERHGVIYAAEFGWGRRFEGLVGQLFGNFARDYDPARERCWIAEMDGERVGCVFVVQREPGVAQLRCLLVDPKARGHGVGKALVDACVGFAREAGYQRMMLWTNKGLDSARRIYEAVGFRLIEEQSHRDFGVELIGQNWEMSL